MNRKEFLKNIENTYRDGLELLAVKNTDYANPDDPFFNFRNSEVAGVSIAQGILVRTMDKITRISNLSSRQFGTQAVKNEKLTDSILDAINYLAILKAHLDDVRPLDK